jgi:MFS family permease
LAISQVPLATLATSNTSEAARGAVAGLYNMAQQAGTAIGLAAFSAVAVAYAHGSTVTDQVRGLQAAVLGTAALALAGAVLAWLTLPRGNLAEVPSAPAGESERALGPAVLPVQMETGTES